MITRTIEIPATCSQISRPLPLGNMLRVDTVSLWTAIQDVAAPFVVFTQHGAPIPERYHEEFERFMDRHPDACVATPQFRARGSKVVWSGGVLFGEDATAHRMEGYAGTPRPVPAAWGPCLVVRKAAFTAETESNLALEGPYALMDLTLRAGQRGWTTRVMPDLIVDVDGPVDWLELPSPPFEFSTAWQRHARDLTLEWHVAHLTKPDGRPVAPHTQQAPAEERPIRILVDLARLSPRGTNGGIKIFISELLRALMRNRGNEFQLLWLLPHSLMDEAADLAAPEDQLWFLPADGAPGKESGRTHQLTHVDATLPHCLDVDLLYAPLGISDFRQPDIPTIGVAVDVLHRDFPDSLPPHGVRERESWFRDMAATDFAVQCISNWTADRMVQHFRVPRTRLFVTYCAVQSRIPRAPVGREGARPVFLYPANSWPHKNHVTLLEGYARYAAAHRSQPWELVLTGHQDDGMAMIRDHAARLGLGDLIKLMGFLDIEAFGELWAQTGALVFPSLHEGFGMPLLEAMRLGVPIVAGAVCSIPEVVGDACLYVDVRDPQSIAAGLARIETDDDLRRSLVSRGMRRLDLFHIEKSADELASVFRRAARTRNSLRDRSSLPASRVSQDAAARRATIPTVLARLHQRLGSLLPRLRQRESPDRTPEVLHHVDAPTHWDNPVHHLHIRGWCFSQKGPHVTGIVARWEGREAHAAYGLPRPDVAVHFNRSDVVNCGFTLQLRRQECISRTIHLVAIRADGSVAALQGCTVQ